MSDEIHQESSGSNEDINADSSAASNNNNCPCLPSTQQKDISQALFKVPEGFQALLKHITRELLNAKPKDPYVYIADFLRCKVNDERKGLLEEEFFNDDTLNIDIRPPMHYLQQTSLANVTCPSTSAFDQMASEAATTLQASYRGVQGRGEVQEVKRDPERKPQFGETETSGRKHSQNSSAGNRQQQDLCGKITPSVVEGCRTGSQQRGNTQQQPRAGRNSHQWSSSNDARRR